MDAPAYEARLDATLMDAAVARPFRLGMSSSLDIAWTPYRAAGLGLREASDATFHNEIVGRAVGLGADYALAFFGRHLVVLVHEEWHLAALREGGVTGTDRWWEGEVVDVADAELVAFKDGDPAGLVRAHAAGVEMQNAFVRRIADEGFLHASQGLSLGPFESGVTFMAPHAQATELNTFQYLLFCASSETDDVIEYVEGLGIPEADRDFTGPDCTAWARDLLRPDEPYEARGPYGSGDGIGRAVGWSDLSAEERALLEDQVLLHLLSLANPSLYGIDRVRVFDGYATASLQHGLAPYGWYVDLHGGWRGAGPAILATARLGRSDRGAYPSLDVELRDVRLGERLRVDVGAGAWAQPEDLRWGARGVGGGHVSARAGWRALERVEPFVGLEAKTAGWVPGVAALDAGFVARAGVTGWLGRPSAGAP